MNQNYSQTLSSVGSGGSGQLMQSSDHNDKHVFSEVDLSKNFEGNINIKKFRLNGMYGLCQFDDGSLIYWGESPLQTENTNQKFVTDIPAKIMAKQIVKQFSCGWQHALLLCDNSVYGFGSNKFYELGLPLKINYNQPTQIIITQKVIKVFGGFRQSAFIDEVFDLYCCGNNKFGEISSSSELFIQQFSRNELYTQVKAVKFGQKFMLVLKMDRSLYGQGANNFGQLAIREDIKQSQSLLLCDKVKKFDSGWSHHVVLRFESPYLIAAGRNNFGQLGIRLEQSPLNTEPQRYIHLDNYIANPDTVQNIKCGSDSTYLLFSDKLLASGWNEHGNIGNGNTENIQEFIKLQIPWQNTNSKLIASGATCFLIQNYSKS